MMGPGHKTLILVCAAGRSSRMGGPDKLLLTLGGSPLLGRVIQNAKALMGDPLVVVGPSHVGRAEIARRCGVPVVLNPHSDQGMASTLRLGAAHAAAYEYLMVVLADLPYLSSLHMARILVAPRDYPLAKIWRPVKPDGTPGHPILFHQTLRPALLQLQGDMGARAIIDANRADLAEIEIADRGPFLDIDTPQDAALHSIPS